MKGMTCYVILIPNFKDFFSPGPVLRGISNVDQDSMRRLPVETSNLLKTSEDVLTFVPSSRGLH
jgi:hypothetical protein